MDKKKPINNIWNVGLSTKYGCIMCTTIVYWQTADILACLVLSYPIQESQHPNFE
jgi:hypothetical protein